MGALVLHGSLCPLLCGFAIPLMEEAEPMDISAWDKNQRVENCLQEWVCSLRPASTLGWTCL